MQDIRNIAIIAHVDHGKTTLVDKMMLAGNLSVRERTSANRCSTAMTWNVREASPSSQKMSLSIIKAPKSIS